jgi:hypothetical protein
VRSTRWLDARTRAAVRPGFDGYSLDVETQVLPMHHAGNLFLDRERYDEKEEDEDKGRQYIGNEDDDSGMDSAEAWEDPDRSVGVTTLSSC